MPNARGRENAMSSDLFKYNDEREAASAAKVRALEALLIEKGVIGSDSVDAVLDHFEKIAGPFNGARIERDAVHRHRSFQPVRPGRTEILEGTRVHLTDSALFVAQVAR